MTLSAEQPFGILPQQQVPHQQLVPCHQDFFQTMLDLLPYTQNDSPAILDLGCGPGELSLLLIRQYPRARLTLCDQCPDMLSLAKQNLGQTGSGTSFYTCNYAERELDGEYDVVMSALALKPLAPGQQQRLLQRLYRNLRPGGLLIVADQFSSQDNHINELHRSQWIRQFRRNGIKEDDISAALLRLSDSSAVPLQQHLEWLEQAGFADLHCWYKNFGFAVYSARHPD